MEHYEIYLRLILTFFLALFFGLERQKSHKPIGFGTFIYVSVGSCSLALAATMSFVENPMPLLSAIVTGIGFLGAGALIKTTDKIFGFTTASAVWLFAILGLLIGTGHYDIGLFLYVLIWSVLGIDMILAMLGVGSYQKKLTVMIKGVAHENDIIDFIDKTGITKHHILSMDVDKVEKKSQFIIIIEGKQEKIDILNSKLHLLSYVESYKLE